MQDGAITLRVRAMNLLVCQRPNSLSLAQVEDKLFRVDRFFLERDSDRFRKLFAASVGTENNGKSDEGAIELKDTRALDFKRFLAILYPMLVDLAPTLCYCS